LNEVARTTQNKDNALFQFERFTTKGLPKPTHKYVAYTCRYLINKIERSKVRTAQELLPGTRNSDMIRCTGISINLEVLIEPKSTFHIRLLMF